MLFVCLEKIPFMIKEHWKAVVGYEGYEVSNLGRVRRFYQNGNVKILKCKKAKTGYLYVHLCKNGKEKYCRLHRLVAIAFIPNPQNLPCINHKTERKDENVVWINSDGSIDFNKTTIEWCDYLYNNIYGSRIQRISKRIAQYTLDGELVAIYSSTMEAERQTGFFRANISNCCLGKIKSYKGFIWQYLI